MIKYRIKVTEFNNKRKVYDIEIKFVPSRIVFMICLVVPIFWPVIIYTIVWKDAEKSFNTIDDAKAYIDKQLSDYNKVKDNYVNSITHIDYP